MTITPLRLLILCIIAFSVFYGFETSQSSGKESGQSNYRLNDGSLVVSVKSPNFEIDPFIGLKKNSISTNRRMTIAQASLTDDCPGCLPDIPTEAALVGEVARTAIDCVQSKPRLAFVRPLMTLLKKPVLIAAVPPKKQIKTAPKKVDKPKKQPISIRRARRFIAKSPQKTVSLLTRVINDTRESTSRRAEAFYWRGKARKKLNEPLSCIKDMRQAIKLAPRKALYLNGLAWVLVTVRPRKLRNSKDALSFAEKAVKLTKGKRANYLDTLAKTQFAMGKAEDAVETQAEAVSLAPNNRSFVQRLRRYEMAVTAD